tara:strand:- start:91 stop:393 length:303 start_codon:yes stop_codon:yes gene_type:complete
MIMKIEDKRVTFPKSLSVKYAGKIVEETDTHLTLEGEDEDSFLKIYSPFRGVAKLLLFENDQWVDAETSSAISNFDLSSHGLGDLSALSAKDDTDSSADK